MWFSLTPKRSFYFRKFCFTYSVRLWAVCGFYSSSLPPPPPTILSLARCRRLILAERFTSLDIENCCCYCWFSADGTHFIRSYWVNNRIFWRKFISNYNLYVESSFYQYAFENESVLHNAKKVALSSSLSIAISLSLSPFSSFRHLQSEMRHTHKKNASLWNEKRIKYTNPIRPNGNEWKNCIFINNCYLRCEYNGRSISATVVVSRTVNVQRHTHTKNPAISVNANYAMAMRCAYINLIIHCSIYTENLCVFSLVVAICWDCCRC